MTWKTLMVACVATVLLAGCKDTTRTLAGGEQIDTLHRMKTIAAQTEQQAAQRFNDLEVDSHTQDLDAAARDE